MRAGSIAAVHSEEIDPNRDAMLRAKCVHPSLSLSLSPFFSHSLFIISAVIAIAAAISQLRVAARKFLRKIVCLHR